MEDICSVEGCGKIRDSKGYCHNHYALFSRNGYPGYKERQKFCNVENCKAKPIGLGYCRLHYIRLKRNIPLNMEGHANRGIRNGNWKGGTADYINHSLMKRVRKEVLKEANNICHFCGGPANQIHHKDLSKDNHSKENLVACCYKCNFLPEHRTSKYKRLYGYTLNELSKKLNIPLNKTYQLHISDELTFCLKNI